MPDKERAISLFSDYGVPDMFLNDLYDEIEECFALELDKAEKWDEAMSRPDFLSQALNEGDGVYRP